MDNYKPKWPQFLSVPTAIVTHPRSKSLTCICGQCGHNFQASRSDAKYCSVQCRKAASRRKYHIERARKNAQREILYIKDLAAKYPDLDIFASLQLDEIRKLLNVTTGPSHV